MNPHRSRPEGTLFPSEQERDGVKGPQAGSRVPWAYRCRAVFENSFAGPPRVDYRSGHEVLELRVTVDAWLVGDILDARGSNGTALD